MLQIKSRNIIYNNIYIYFSKRPYNVNNCSKVIFYSCVDDVTLDGFKKVIQETVVIDLDNSFDNIWKGISKSYRKDIKKAEKNNTIITINKNHRDFIKLLKDFNKQRGLKAPIINIDNIENQGLLLVAKLNNEILCARYFLYDETTIRQLYSPSNPKLNIEEIGLANKLMIWEAIKFSKNNKLKEYDMGGICTGNNCNEKTQNINNFKISFGGRIVKKYHYIKYYSYSYYLISYVVKKILFIQNILKNRLFHRKP